jgi:murein DD-endopeptidase MepM/ murein hydrolase activator NlpD
MYWGRTSFYRNAFQAIVAFVTLGALIASISSRTVIVASEEKGVLAASGIIGNNDMFLQSGTTDSITEAQVSKVDYEIAKYTVKSGDTLSSIAQKFGVKTDTIRWANNIPSGRDTLTVGQVLDIPPMNGVLYTVVAGDNLDKIIRKVQGANKFDLIELNNLQPPDYGVWAGQKLFIPDATYKPVVAATRRTSSGGSYVSIPNSAVNVAPGTFVNPMSQCRGYTFLRGWRYSHTGVDLGHAAGCWIVAAGSGVITRAGWCGSMGYCTVIRHDNGYSTLYMHGQGKFAVRTGQRVSAGQAIMTLGSTGYSFGPHLHLSLSAPGVDVVSNYHGRINPAGIIPY